MSALLTRLRNDLNHWNGRVTAINAELTRLRRRLRDVEGVKRDLISNVNSGAGNVNTPLQSARNNLNSGIRYSSRDSQLNAILSGKDERTVGVDSSLTSADSDLQREINTVQNRISELERELATAQQNVTSTRAAITAEERRIREEALRAAANRITGG
jgi:prefoldin subunit 5